MAVVVKPLTGSNSDRYDKVPYRHIYILNDGNTGWIKINEAIELDVEKIDKVEDLIIKRLEWAISGSGSTFAILSHEKLSTDYIMRLMLSRIYTELQKKSSKKKIVYVDASSSTTVTAGSSEVVTVQPPSGKIWRILNPNLKCDPPSGATSGNHNLIFIQDPLTEYHFHAIYAYDTQIRFYGLKWRNSPSSYNGSSVTENRTLFDSMKISYDYPLNIKYQNSTDADQTNTRTIKLILEEEDEAE